MDFSEIEKNIPDLIKSEANNILSRNRVECRVLFGVKRSIVAGSIYLKSRLLSLQKSRNLNFVSKVYSSIYGRSNDEWVERRTNNRYVLEFSQERLEVNGWFLLSIYVHLIDKILKGTKAGHVIEIGSGRGNNIVTLALKNPDIKFTGLEYSDNGVMASHALMNNVPLELVKMAGNRSFTEKDMLNKNVTFYVGNAFKAPFRDNSFDLSYTILALEQMPHKFQNAVIEMKRITRKYCVFVEPFREANPMYGRLHLETVDYFRSSFKSFIKFGLRPVYFTDNFPQKYKYHTGLLITEVMH